MRLKEAVLASLVAPALCAPEPAAAQTDSILPVALPAPWGEHAIGMRVLVVEDSSRTVADSDGASGPRPVLVRVWYPARSGSGRPKAYMDSALAEAWRSTLPVPAGFERRVAPHAEVDAPWADPTPEGGWPVLLFSHGRSFPVENYQIALEQLASQGWVVAALSHVGEEALTALPDGRVFPFSGPGWEAPGERGQVLMGVVDEFALDASRALDALEREAAESGGPFEGRLALEDGVGYFGHSLGGAAAVWTMQRDRRVRAAASWEGQVYRDQDRPLTVRGPLLYLIGSANRRDLSWSHFRSGGAEAPVYEAVIRGAWHASFGELLHVYRAYGPREWQEGHRREITAERANQISADLLDAFFGAHLLGRASDLLRPDTPEEGEDTRRWNYPEVDLSASAAPSGAPADRSPER